MASPSGPSSALAAASGLSRLALPGSVSAGSRGPQADPVIKPILPMRGRRKAARRFMPQAYHYKRLALRNNCAKHRAGPTSARPRPDHRRAEHWRQWLPLALGRRGGESAAREGSHDPIAIGLHLSCGSRRIGVVHDLLRHRLPNVRADKFVGLRVPSRGLAAGLDRSPDSAESPFHRTSAEARSSDALSAGSDGLRGSDRNGLLTVPVAAAMASAGTARGVPGNFRPAAIRGCDRCFGIRPCPCRVWLRQVQ